MLSTMSDDVPFRSLPTVLDRNPPPSPLDQYSFSSFFSGACARSHLV